MKKKATKRKTVSMCYTPDADNLMTFIGESKIVAAALAEITHLLVRCSLAKDDKSDTARLWLQLDVLRYLITDMFATPEGQEKLTKARALVEQALKAQGVANV